MSPGITADLAVPFYEFLFLARTANKQQ